jgi:hypothetical protein
MQAFLDLIAIADFLSFPTFNHLPRFDLLFEFGIRNAHAWLWGAAFLSEWQAQTHIDFRRKTQ